MPLKVKFQDKRSEKTDIGEQNIPENSVSNRTAVEIRIKRHLYTGVGGIEKRKEEEKEEKKIEKKNSKRRKKT